MAKALQPEDKNFWSRAVEQVGKTLPGEVVEVGEKQQFVIARIQLFRGLPRQAMSKVFDSKERKPGQVFIAPFRGSPLINVTCSPTQGDPEVIWLREFQSGSQTVTGAQIARLIASHKIGYELTQEGFMEFCLNELDGSNVKDADSLLRVMSNTALLLKDRKIRSTDLEEGAKNCIDDLSLDS